MGVSKGIVPSRGMDAESDLVSRAAEVDRIWAARQREIAARRAPVCDGTCCDDDGCAPGASDVAGLCFLIVTLVVVAALAWWAIGGAK